jgi:DNA-binding IclR family transcriptional regulator
VFRGAALEHATRARLLDAVEAQPGVTLQALARRLNAPRNTLAHHLRVLERTRYVTRVRVANGHAIYPRHDPRARLAATLNRAHVHGLLSLLAQRPDATQQELAHAVPIAQSRLSEILSALETHGLVARRRDGRRMRVRLTNAGAAFADSSSDLRTTE